MEKKMEATYYIIANMPMTLGLIVIMIGIWEVQVNFEAQE